jgi:long-chain acyl-CoA synthetase
LKYLTFKFDDGKFFLNEKNFRSDKFKMADKIIFILDRKKDLVKLQHGEYISLGKVESELKTCPFVENALIYCDSTKTNCVALIAPAEVGIKALAATIGVTGTFEEIVENKEVHKLASKSLQEHAQKCNLLKWEIPTAITLCKELWTPESGLVTAAFKIKRKEIHEMYRSDLDRMYS